MNQMTRTISIFTIFLLISVIACGGSGGGSSVSFDRTNYDLLFTDPDKYEGANVDIIGRVFTAPERDEEGTYWQMWADPINSEWNTVVGIKASNVEVSIKVGDYVHVKGRVASEFKEENLFGGETRGVMVEAQSATVVDALAIAPPAIRVYKGEPDTKTQHGLKVSLLKVEFAQTETRIFLTVTNSTRDNAIFYPFNVKAMQGKQQFEFDFSSPPYPKVQSELMPGAVTSGVVVLTPMDSETETRIFTDGSTSDWNLTFKPYDFFIPAINAKAEATPLVAPTFTPMPTYTPDPTPSPTATALPAATLTPTTLPIATLTPTVAPLSSTIVDLVDTVGNILDLYEGNEFAADIALTGKWVQMRGKVERVESVYGKIEVSLIGSLDIFRMNNLVCKIGVDQTDEAIGLRRDDVVVVTGKLLGMTDFFNVIAEPCQLPSTQPNSSNQSRELGDSVSSYGNTVYFQTPVTREKAQQYIDSLNRRGIATPETSKSWQLRMVNGEYEIRAGRWNSVEMRYFTDGELAEWETWYEGNVEAEQGYQATTCARQEEDFDGTPTQLIIVFSSMDLSIPAFDYVIQRFTC